MASKVLERSKTVTHLRNVNMDTSLSGSIRYLIEKDGALTIGAPGKADIGLNGIGYVLILSVDHFYKYFIFGIWLIVWLTISIFDKHAILTRVGDKYTLKPCENAKVLQNGKQVMKEVELKHMDRLVFGTSQYYLFAVPAQATPTDPYYTFEMMQVIRLPYERLPGRYS